MEKDYFCCLVAVIELPYDKTIVACMKWRERKNARAREFANHPLSVKNILT